MVRLRQVVVAARELEPAVEELRAALPLGEPFADPGVGLFGLHNAVMALGDCFVEVVSPAQEGTAAGRFLDRDGDGPYMVLFQVDDLPAARERVQALGIREVWGVELPDIAAVHLHPADIGGAIVSLDQPVPPESWRWGGPDWAPTGNHRTAGVTLTAADPDATRERWSTVLGGETDAVTIRPGDRDGIASFEVDLGPERRGEELRLAGARFVAV
jgi:hypothetical protein